jgi:shikimate kinase
MAVITPFICHNCSLLVLKLTKSLTKKDELCCMGKVFLVGYMGSGKTTVGKQLAQTLGYPFIDLDRSIEAGERTTISAIFKAHGEAGFRGLERRYLKKISTEHADFVLSTGGGTPCFNDNMQFMLHNGVVVYLKMDVASLVYRLIHAKEERPLLAGKNEAELLAYVKHHLEERSAYYEDAHIIYSALGMNRVKLDELTAHIRAFSAKTDHT